jgi:hypothetical protein
MYFNKNMDKILNKINSPFKNIKINKIKNINIKIEFILNL